MATKFGVGNEMDVQYACVDAVGRVGSELIAPQTMGLPRWPLVPSEADHIGTLAGLRGKLEVAEDDLLEVIQACHGPPTSGTADDQRYRSVGLCRGTPAGKSWRA